MLFVIGVFDPEKGPDAQTFVYSDGAEEGIDFVRVDVGEFPWQPDEPAGGGDENCAE